MFAYKIKDQIIKIFEKREEFLEKYSFFPSISNKYKILQKKKNQSFVWMKLSLKRKRKYKWGKKSECENDFVKKIVSKYVATVPIQKKLNLLGISVII